MTKVEFSDVVISKDWTKVTVECPRYSRHCDWGHFVSSRMGVGSMTDSMNPCCLRVWGAGEFWPTDKIFEDAQRVCRQCAAGYNALLARIKQCERA